MTVEAAIEKFLEWVKLHRADNTWRLYRSRLGAFARAYNGRELLSLVRLDLENWLARSSRRPDGTLLAPDTRRANAISLSVWQRWCVDHGFLTAPIADNLEKPPGRQRERIPTDEETAKILEAGTPAFVRIYRALRQTGARPGELCGATIEQWQRDQGVIVLTDHKTAAKTGRDRRIAVGQKFSELLNEAVGDRTSGPIFLDDNGLVWNARRLSATYRKLRDKLGLPKDLVLYLTRHEHATQIVKKLGIFEAKEALGHTSIKTTQRYAHATDAERAKNQDVFE